MWSSPWGALAFGTHQRLVADAHVACRYLSGKQGSRNVPAVNNPMWQAPEVIADSGRCSKQGDVYSFGVVMWELLMMSRPWVGVPLPLISQYVQVRNCPQ